MEDNLRPLFTLLMLASTATGVTAEGRHDSSVWDLMKVYQASERALDAARKGYRDLALRNALAVRALAVASREKEHLGPLWSVSKSLNLAMVSIEKGKLSEAIPLIEAVLASLDEAMSSLPVHPAAAF